MRPGQFNVTSIPLVKYHGSRPAVLLDVRPAVGAEARGLLFRYAASTGSGAHIGLARGWKPQVWGLRPLRGFEIRPGESAAVVIGATASRNGIYFVHSFVVSYRVGGTHYRTRYRVGIKTCIGTGPSCPN